MGQPNQIHWKWVRLLPSPDNPNESYLVIREDRPMDGEAIQVFEEHLKDSDCIISIAKLLGRRNNNAERI